MDTHSVRGARKVYWEEEKTQGEKLGWLPKTKLVLRDLPTSLVMVPASSHTFPSSLRSFFVELNVFLLELNWEKIRKGTWRRPFSSLF